MLCAHLDFHTEEFCLKPDITALNLLLVLGIMIADCDSILSFPVDGVLLVLCHANRQSSNAIVMSSCYILPSRSGRTVNGMLASNKTLVFAYCFVLYFVLYFIILLGHS